MVSREIKEARINAGLSASEAAALVGVKTVTWQRWEGQTSRVTEIPYAHWNLFLLLTDSHPVYRLAKKDRAYAGLPLINRWEWIETNMDVRFVRGKGE